MGILSQIFGSKSKTKKEVEKSTIHWKELKSIEQLDEIIKESKSKTVAIFKHSFRCSISGMVIRQFESSFRLEEDQMSVYYLDLLGNREVSDEVAAKFQVWHQSPQLIIVKNGQTLAHASHSSILKLDLEKYI